MKVLGIIAEYNPFHFGHLYHLKQSLRLSQADYTIAVMSGQFTQRGEAAITDKWIRAEAAIACGVDLVLELPTMYAVQTAELFALGGIQVLNHTGLVTHVSFGSETGELTSLQSLADFLIEENVQYKAALKTWLDQGLSFPAARQRAVADNFPGTWEPALQKAMTGSNSILAIEYLKALKKTNSLMIPITLPRIRNTYASTRIKRGLASATSIRKEILKHGMSPKVREAIPLPVYQLLSEAFAKGLGPADNTRLENLLLGTLRRSSLSEIASWMDVNEGLENRIKEQALAADSLEEFLSLVKTRRYVHTRLQRILIHGLLNLTTEGFQELHDEAAPPYLRILAFAKNAIPLLKRLKETAVVPVLTKTAHISRLNFKAQKIFSYDALATDLYGLALTHPEARRGNRDFTHKVFPL